MVPPQNIQETEDGEIQDVQLQSQQTASAVATADNIAAPTLMTAQNSAPAFRAPTNIPQDLAVIMGMVANDEVVGALPPVSMTAAEKRKLVEESMKAKQNGKGKDAVAAVDHKISPKQEEASDSDSSSEFESSSEEESEDEASAVPEVPMTEEEHRVLKSELDSFVGKSDALANAGFELMSDSESDEDEDYSFDLGKMGFEFMEDEEEDAGPSGGAAIVSTHEAPLPAVPQPPLIKLPEGQGLSLAGDVVSWMREKKVEAWLEKKQQEAEAAEMEEAEKGLSLEEVKPEPVEGGEAVEVTMEVTTAAKQLDSSEGQNAGAIVDTTPKKAATTLPKFVSSGTIVVRAMQSRPGDYDEGWLEEGSVLCWEDGRVLGTVHETFGPLTSPFYSIRLPPPPFPYPEPESLVPGTRLFYPLNPLYRSFVNMLALRDPRLKGSDASNIYDEEVGDDEREWSDDEAEAMAKREKKNRKGGKKGKTPSVAGTPRSSHPSLPARPHFDFQPTDNDEMSEAGSLYGGGEEMSEGGLDAESVASTRGRPKPMPYDFDDSMNSQPSAGGNGGRNSGRGRGGQGRERGRGRGRGGRGGGGGHDGGRQAFPLPSNPMQQQQMNQPPPQQYMNQWQQPQQQFMPGMPGFSHSFPQMMGYPQMGMQHQPPQGSYEPAQPSTGMPMPMFPSQHQPPQHQQGGVAINPRFAPQYQMMMGMGQQQQQQQQQPDGGQEQQYGYGHYGQQQWQGQ